MVEIRDILLFYSMHSQKCRTIFAFIEHHNLPVSPLCVDKKQVRDAISENSTFHVKGVPTIIVIYNDGNAEMYEGVRSLQFLKDLVRENQNPPPEEESEDEIEIIEDDGDIPYEEESQQPTGLMYSQKKNVKEQKMASVKDLAKQMEIQRKSTLGYDDDKLPKY